jgi:hypothetical protein
LGFEKHLFISYAHLDNEPLSAETQGWISRFHKSLEAVLSMRLGRKAQIWRDTKLAGNDVFADEIVAQFPKTAVLLSVLTPRYIESDWCAREVQKFCEAASESGGLLLENKARIIKVIKTPVDREDPLPDVMREMLGYQFYISDEGRAPVELDPAYGAEVATKYHVKVAELAWDIAQLIKKLEPMDGRQNPAAAEASPKPVVYLAHCSYDRRAARDALEAELKIQGYRVVPDRQLPAEQEAFIADVRRWLEMSKLTIHLISSAYGAVPDGPTEKSTAMLQNELAVETSRTAGLRRIIWLPEGTSSTNEMQRDFLHSLRNDANAQFGADLITADFETLKSAVHDVLKKLEAPAPRKDAALGPAGQSRLIYLVCDQRDLKATVPLRKILAARGHEVETPLFEGDAATVSRANEEMLKQCDAVLVFYGAGDEAWRRAVQSDVRKMKAYRNGRALLAEYSYVGPPGTAAKTDLVDTGPRVIDGLTGFSEEALAPFLKMVEAS